MWGQATSATCKQHVSATQTPRGLHVGAAGRGAPVIAGGDSGHPGTRGWARWKEENKGNHLVAAPLGFGHRSNGGERFCGGRSSAKMDSTNPSANASEVGSGRELSSPGAQRASRGGEARRESTVSDLGGRRTELGKTVELEAFLTAARARGGRGDDGEPSGGLGEAREGAERRR